MGVGKFYENCGNIGVQNKLAELAFQRPYATHAYTLQQVVLQAADYFADDESIKVVCCALGTRTCRFREIDPGGTGEAAMDTHFQTTSSELSSQEVRACFFWFGSSKAPSK